MTRDKVFIGYSRRDKEWLARLQKMLKPLVHQGAISLWVDTEIKAGAQWKEEIENAIAAARIAVLLVSAEFLASDFVVEEELPRLQRAAEEEGVRILWIYLSPCNYRATPIVEYQAAHDLAASLLELPFPEQERTLLKISNRIKEAFVEAEQSAEREQNDSRRQRRLAKQERKFQEPVATREAEKVVANCVAEAEENQWQAELKAEEKQLRVAAPKRKADEQKRQQAVGGPVRTPDINREDLGETPAARESPSVWWVSKLVLWLVAPMTLVAAVFFSIGLWTDVEAPTAILEAQPASIDIGAPAILSWATTGAAEVSLEPDLGAVETQGSRKVMPQRETRYRLVARGAGGVAEASALVQVTLPAERPTASLTAEPPAIKIGESTFLSWTTAGATEVRIEPGLGSVEAQGSKKVSPKEETTYRLVAVGRGGEAEHAIAVKVEGRPPSPQPTAILAADPQTVVRGQSTTLKWTTTGATGVRIEPGLGSVKPQGSKQVSPEEKVTYKLMVTGAGGVAEDLAVVDVTAQSFRDCDHCPEMVVIPAGRFTMGSRNFEPEKNEEPQHEVRIADDCIFRGNPTTCSDGRRPLVPTQSDHRFRSEGDHFVVACRKGGRLGSEGWSLWIGMA